MKNKIGILQFIKERFPLQVLTFTTLSTVFASSAISVNGIDFYKVFIAFVITTLFLFHIRAIDERRDYINDSELHPNRPIQRGIISIKSILGISISGIVLSLILAFFTSLPTFILALFFVVFTSLSAFDFFIPKVFKNKPVIYHIVNSPQMILLQWLIFSIFTSSFSITKEMFLFMLLIYNNIFIIEVVRKTNAPEHDTNDSYTKKLGLKKSVAFLILLVLTGFVIFSFLVCGMKTQITFVYGAILSAIIIGIFLIFYFKPQKEFEKYIQLSAVLLYVFMNVFLFIAK